MPPLDLDELDRLYAATTPGSWMNGSGIFVRDIHSRIIMDAYSNMPEDEAAANTTFIAAMHNAYPDLIARLREVEAERDATRAREATVRQALDYAIQIIESYEFDIRHSRAWTGVDLMSLGFCQGIIYREAVADIKRRRGNEKT